MISQLGALQVTSWHRGCRRGWVSSVTWQMENERLAKELHSLRAEMRRAENSRTASGGVVVCSTLRLSSRLTGPAELEREQQLIIQNWGEWPTTSCPLTS